MTTLTQKLLIKPGKNWLFYNAPDNFLATLEPLPEGVVISLKPTGDFSGIQLFVKNTAELEASLNIIAPLLKAETIFWIAYPKKSSGIKTDLEMMSSWDEAGKYGLNTVAAISVNEIWTALRFRPAALSKQSEGRNDSVRQNEHSQYIDVDNKIITLPTDIADVLQQNPQAMAFYQQLSYSNRKEYVLWILTAKQEKTRNERLSKMVEKLTDGKKNPSEK
jgi:hypothetical protein